MSTLYAIYLAILSLASVDDLFAPRDDEGEESEGHH